MIQLIDTTHLNTTMSGWDAYLQLGFEQRDHKTVLVKRQHAGPLTIQKCLYPEGPTPAHILILHPPGGIAGGDTLAIHVDLATDSHALLTTPGATKWYKAAGRKASQTVSMRLESAAKVEWFPQENIVFDGADIELNTLIELEGNACFAGWDISCLGRQASGESWQQGHYRQQVQVKRDNTLLWFEKASFKPDSPVISSIAGLRNYPVFGSFIVAAGEVPESVLTACREVTIPNNNHFAVSVLPEVFTARYMGNCAQEAKVYFEQLWACLRPWYAERQAERPRIWAT